MARTLTVVLLAITLALPGCSVALRAFVHNNTTNEIVVRYAQGGMRHAIGPSETVEITLQSEIWIDFGPTTHRYKAAHLNIREFQYGPLQNKVNLQAEADGRIYVVTPSMPLPAKSQPRQPEGLPLAPDVSRG